jgi:ADP-heptose:LPS heptosyltransferase
VLKCHQSPGDVVMLTAAVRELHHAYPGRFLTDVRTTAPEIWENNPHVTRLDERGSGVEVVPMHYPLIHQSNTAPYHFVHGFTRFLSEHLGLPIPVQQFRGDIHLSAAERADGSFLERFGLQDGYWVLVAGGKYDFTAKWWNPDCHQRVVDHFAGRIHFVQCGEGHHWHPPLERVTNIVGRTSIRDFIRLVYHSDGVLCPVTFAMHLAAAVETKPGKPKNRACVVVAGGREPPHWEAYPHHQFLSTNGALLCCDNGGCWKSRCQPVGDGDVKDREGTCVAPVTVRPGLCIPRCMDMITAADVVRRIEMYYEGGALRYASAPRVGLTLEG